MGHPEEELLPTARRSRALPWIVLVLLLLEGLQFTVYRKLLSGLAAPITLYLTAVALCVATYLAIRRRPWPVALGPGPGRVKSWLPAVLGLVVGLVVAVPRLRSILHATVPQDLSDVIPAITVYCQRLLDGETVHQPLTEHIGYFLEPGYLPAMWFPFVVPELLQFDYRWMSSAVLLLGMLAYVVLVIRLRQPAPVAFGLSVLPPLLAYGVLVFDHGTFSIVLEPLVIGYYMLLVAGVLLRWRPLVVVTLVLCLLSRYSLVFWVPLYLGLVYVGESRRWAFSLAGLVAAGVLLLYVVPVLSHDWGLFARVQAVYTDTTLGEWQHPGDDGLPVHLFNGIGLTSLFYTTTDADMPARIQLAKLAHLGLIVSIIAGAAVLYWRQRLPRSNYRAYAVLVLKLYLTTFYAFLQVPYSYLAATGFFVSLYMLVLAVGPAVEPAPATPRN